MSVTAANPAANSAGASAAGPAARPPALGAATTAELKSLAARYPDPRSALLPMLHLVQSAEGRVSEAGIAACAELLDLPEAQVAGVSTFYTMYHRRPGGRHHLGVCTTTLCAVMGGDQVLQAVEAKLGVAAEETTADGLFSLERVECNAACDFAPVMMVNWEFMDNMTPAKAVALIDDLMAGKTVRSTRGAEITSWREAERVLAGFDDGRADEGPSAGPASLRGVAIARERGWTAEPMPAKEGADA
ncbi:MAG: NADH-quinone oxidoreductase subunit NuoE [Propionibacteriaceae bacterium]|jgi:NADH-quinone oxidoreductase subunit E|nr:NADH-quinone oxidoreductase subunit NuoE [Propionibacteriaceae bacterium]